MFSCSSCLGPQASTGPKGPAHPGCTSLGQKMSVIVAEWKIFGRSWTIRRSFLDLFGSFWLHLRGFNFFCGSFWPLRSCVSQQRLHVPSANGLDVLPTDGMRCFPSATWSNPHHPKDPGCLPGQPSQGTLLVVPIHAILHRPGLISAT